MDGTILVDHPRTGGEVEQSNTLPSTKIKDMSIPKDCQ
jgi:hypothetical protein